MMKKLLISALIVGSVVTLTACNKTPVEPEVLPEVEMVEPEVIILDAEDFGDVEFAEEDLFAEEDFFAEEDVLTDENTIEETDVESSELIILE